MMTSSCTKELEGPVAALVVCTNWLVSQLDSVSLLFLWYVGYLGHRPAQVSHWCFSWDRIWS